MSRLAFRVVLQEFSPHLVEDSVAAPPAGSTPSGTYENMRINQGLKEDTLHAIRSLGEPLNDELLVLLAPSPHLRV